MFILAQLTLFIIKIYQAIIMTSCLVKIRQAVLLNICKCNQKKFKRKISGSTRSEQGLRSILLG